MSTLINAQDWSNIVISEYKGSVRMAVHIVGAYVSTSLTSEQARKLIEALEQSIEAVTAE